MVIDSVDRGSVDLYAPTVQWQVAQSYSGLSAGPHTIEIRPLHTRNPSATGYLVPVDAFSGPITVAGSLATPIEDIQGSNLQDE